MVAMLRLTTVWLTKLRLTMVRMTMLRATTYVEVDNEAASMDEGWAVVGSRE